jgi:hypothetical protein
MATTGTRTTRFVRHTPGGVFNVEDQSLSTGDRWYVHSGTGTDGLGYGTHPDSPVATIDYAIGLATASQGDIIFVMPGHAESITIGGIDVDKIGLSIIGLGNGNNRPTISFTATTSDVDIDADDIYISGLRFVSAIDALQVMIDANSENLTMEDCEFVTSSALECHNFINIATTKDYFTFRRCVFRQPTDPEATGGDDAVNTGCFYIVDSENILIQECVFIGEFETSIFHNKTSPVKNLWILDCYGEQALAAADVATIVAAATGGMHRCAWNVPDAADATTIGNFITMAADTPFGYHKVTFMNDNATAGAGEWLALPVNTEST